MKMKMKSRALAILISLAMVFTMMPMMGSPAYAKGNSPSIVKSGTIDDFAKDAPITTVRLDASKFTKTNATLVSKNDYYTWGDGNGKLNADGVWTSDEVTVPKTKDAADLATEGNEILLPSFSITLSDAAIMRDGKRKALKVTFDDIKVFTKGGMDKYIDRFQIARLSSGAGAVGINISPVSLEGQHFGLQAKVTCQVVGAAADDTLLLFSTELNNKRPETHPGFTAIKGAANNDNYTESMQFLSGIDSESDIYLIGIDNYSIDTDPSITTNVSGYNVRLFGNGTPTSDHRNSSLATAVSASGTSANAWSSAGNSSYGLNMFYLSTIKIAKEHTSSSGEGGKIELWTDGLTHDKDSETNNFKKLDGGTLTTPHTYAVPYGKKVTYKMTPEKCHVIDKLYVNGTEVDIAEDTNFTTVNNASGEPEYYEYHFGDSTVNYDQKIQVTWKAQHSITHRDAVAPTCTKNGNIEHYACENCNKYFADEQGTNELDTIVDPMIGHKYGSWIELDDKHHQRVCEHDSTHIETEDHTWDDGIVSIDGTKSVTLYTCIDCKATKEVVNEKKIYKLVSGADGTWTKGNTSPLPFTFKSTVDNSETFDHFSGVKVDGKSVPEKDASGNTNWIAKRGSDGSVIIELQPAYLETLSVGKHKLTASFDDGNDVTAEFTVKEKYTSPKTGDESNLALHCSLMFLSVAAMIVLLLYARKRKIEK